MGFFHTQTAPKAFAVVYVRDIVTNQQSVKSRTRCVASSHPQWKNEFWFAVRHTAGNLVLTVDVFDGSQPCTVNDEPFGTATLTLDNAFLLNATRKRQALELELQPPDARVRSAASVRIEVGWEPALMLKSVADCRSLLWVMARSVYLVRVMGVATLGFASCLLFVAQQARWLCLGTSLPDCKTVDEPALATCAAIAAFTAGTAATVHFSGLMGLFGTAWNERPRSLFDLAEADIEDEDDGVESTIGVEEPRPSVQMQIESLGMMRWKIGLASNLFPRLSWGPMRILCLLAHLCALCLSSVALVIASLNDEGKVFFAEAVYLDTWGMLCLVLAGLMFWQEYMLMQSQAERTVSHHAAHVAHLGNGALAGADSANPAQAFQDMTHIASAKILEAQQRLQDLNTELTQPLLEARQQFQDLNVIAQQRLHNRLDELNAMAQPLSQARQHFQTFGTAHNWIQPLVDAFQPSCSVHRPSLSRQMSAGSSLMVSPSHLLQRSNTYESPLPPNSSSGPAIRSSASEFNGDDFYLGPARHARHDTVNHLQP